MNFRTPAEWEKHEATWLAWPHNKETWTPEELKEVHLEYIQFVKAVAQGEKVYLLCPNEEQREHILNLMSEFEVKASNVELVGYTSNDSWMRDFGPDFLIGKKYKMLDWRYNAWGGKYPPFTQDDQFCDWLAKNHHFESDKIDFVLEGGSVEFNGIGDLMTTESCLLNPNRNPNYSKAEIETLLKEKFLVKNVIWLKDGLEGDDTDGHIDDMFRFVDTNKIVGINIHDEQHADFKKIKENRAILEQTILADGSRVELIDLPVAPVLTYKGDQLPTSYANFYIANEVVVVPQFGHENDEVALAVLRKCFTDREVIGVKSNAIIIGLGSFHCLSKHQPTLTC